MLSFECHNIRGLRHVSFAPEPGVNLLIGPNGSGKTSLLEIPHILRLVFQRGVADAVESMHGAYGLRNFQATDEEGTRLAVIWNEYRWQIEVPLNQQSYDYRIGEWLTISEQLIVERLKYTDFFRYHGEKQPVGNGIALRSLAEFLAKDWPQDRVADFTRVVAAMYAYPAFNSALPYAQPVRQDPVLMRDGSNLFPLLREWMGQRKSRDKYEFVLESCRQAFPGAFSDLEFSSTGQNVSMGLVVPGIETSIPMPACANGIRLALLHLTAAAGVPQGGYLALDEVENGQHPHAVKVLIERLRWWAERQKLTICIASQSPTVINCFREDQDLERIHIMESGTSPRRLVELKDREWLRSFTLGEMYEIEQFGEPASAPERT